jgi:hypothetical protein
MRFLNPPRVTPVVARRGDQGWLVYAVQLGVGVTADGVFGVQTEKAVQAYQAAHGLATDGVVGPATQGKIAIQAVHAGEGAASEPSGLLKGLLLSESGLMIAAVNVAVPGGTDCGLAQYRCYGPPYDFSALLAAFNPATSALRAARDLKNAKEKFHKLNSSLSQEVLWKLAAFAHNWPTQGGADYYAIHGHVQDPTAACTWLPRKAGKLFVTFPDGTLVRTRQDWAEFYAMGGPHGPGMTTRFVRTWSA